jgi:hypothetical protein
MKSEKKSDLDLAYEHLFEYLEPTKHLQLVTSNPFPSFAYKHFKSFYFTHHFIYTQIKTNLKFLSPQKL